MKRSSKTRTMVDNVVVVRYCPARQWEMFETYYPTAIFAYCPLAMETDDYKS